MPVGYSVVCVNGYSFSVIIHSEKVAFVFFEFYTVTGILNVGLNIGGGVRILFKVIPEQTFADSDVEFGETGHNVFQRFGEFFGLYILFQFKGKAKNIRPTVPVLPREYGRRVVQPEPFGQVRVLFFTSFIFNHGKTPYPLLKTPFYSS